MPSHALDLDNTRRRSHLPLWIGFRAALVYAGLLVWSGCAQAQDALPQNQLDVATEVESSPSTPSISESTDAAASAKTQATDGPSREQILAMAASLGATADPSSAALLASTRELVKEFPYNITLVASRGKGDTSLLSSADLLAPHRGKRPVIMMFWMTTCGPCRAELADLETKMAAWKAAYDFAFVPVSLDFEQRRGAFHARAAEYPWTSYFDVYRSFPSVMPGGLNGLPQTFVFDADGKQVYYKRKYSSGDLDAVEEVLKDLGR